MPTLRIKQTCLLEKRLLAGESAVLERDSKVQFKPLFFLFHKLLALVGFIAAYGLASCLLFGSGF